MTDSRESAHDDLHNCDEDGEIPCSICGYRSGMYDEPKRRGVIGRCGNCGQITDRLPCPFCDARDAPGNVTTGPAL